MEPQPLLGATANTGGNMIFSLIICTYQRDTALVQLLESVAVQSLYPDEILIIDASADTLTRDAVAHHRFRNLTYYKVPDADRGLTRQRNYGIARLRPDSEIVCFLDDDTVLEPDYFEILIHTYALFPDAAGVGGYITNDSDCEFVGDDYRPQLSEYFFDGWKRADGSRFVLRKKLGLDSTLPPGFMPEFAHGRSLGFLPPNGKIYKVEQLMGGVSSFRKAVLEKHKFSTYFEGYGLYEDADFTIRVSRTGQLYCNTAARLAHYHDESGRPNQYHYGKMVVRNGWYVWRTKNPRPSWRARLKWHQITLLLTLIRFTNVVTTPDSKQALTEAAGRMTAWFELLFKKPRIT